MFSAPRWIRLDRRRRMRYFACTAILAVACLLLALLAIQPFDASTMSDAQCFSRKVILSLRFIANSLVFVLSMLLFHVEYIYEGGLKPRLWIAFSGIMALVSLTLAVIRIIEYVVQNPAQLQLASLPKARIAVVLALIVASIALLAKIYYDYQADRREWRIFTNSNTNFGEAPLTFREYCQIGNSNL